MEQIRGSGDSAGAEAAGEGAAQRSVQSVEVGGRLLLATVAAPLETRLGILLEPALLDSTSAAILCGVTAAGLLAGLLPGLAAYRRSLADGLSMRT